MHPMALSMLSHMYDSMHIDDGGGGGDFGGGGTPKGGGTVFFNQNFKILSLYVFKTAQTSKSVKIINCMCL